MRPERFAWINPVSARTLPALLAVLLILLALPSAEARASDSAPRSSTDSIYDSASFIKELGRLRAGLESVRKSPETLHIYRESLPEAWAVEAGGRRYDVPTNLLVSHLY